MKAKTRQTKVIRIPSSKFPRYIVQETADDLFVFCLELNKVLKCWQTTHPPSMDPKFRRRLHELPDQPLENLRHEGKVKELDGVPVTIWDNGSYTTGKLGDKNAIEAALEEGLEERKAELVLDGEHLKGKFSIFYDGRSKRWFIHKLKDAHVAEEDPLGFDLERSVKKIIPDFDPDEEDEEEEPVQKRARKGVTASKKKTLSTGDEEATTDEEEEEETGDVPEPASTAGASDEQAVGHKGGLRTSFAEEIKNNVYHFSFYKSIDPNSDEVICLVQQEHGPSFLMTRHNRQWEIETSVPAAIVRKETLLSDVIEHFLDAQDRK